MNGKEIELLNKYGWILICESPLEIEKRSEDDMVEVGSAKGEAVKIVLEYLEEQDSIIFK